MRKWLEGFARARWLVGGLLVLYGVQAWRGLWSGDFWEHGAAIAALIRDPLRPGHPSFALDAPHYFYTPYTLALALLARLFGGGAVGALAWAGAFNLLLLATGAERLVRRLGCARPGPALFYALWLWLFLWGHAAWQFSGFIHFGVLFRVLPYPSTFALGLSFWVLALRGTPGSAWRTAGLGLASAVVLLCHPLTFIFLCAGWAGLGMAEARRFRDWVALAAVPCVAVLVAWPWPYFPVRFLFVGVNEAAVALAAESLVLYESVFARTWPVWLCLPLLAANAGTRAAGRRGIMMAVALLGIAYAGGWFGERVAFGRCIAGIVILLQLLVAERLAALEGVAASPSGRRGARLLAAGTVAAAAGIGVFASQAVAFHQLRLFMDGPVPLHRQLAPVAAALPPGAVVLADRRTGNLLPVFGAKIVYGRFPQALVADARERRETVDRLFGGEATREEWKAAAARWGATHVLANIDEIGAVPEGLAGVGQRMASVDGLELIALPAGEDWR